MPHDCHGRDGQLWWIFKARILAGKIVAKKLAGKSRTKDTATAMPMPFFGEIRQGGTGRHVKSCCRSRFLVPKPAVKFQRICQELHKIALKFHWKTPENHHGTPEIPEDCSRFQPAFLPMIQWTMATMSCKLCNAATGNCPPRQPKTHYGM